MAEIIDFKDRKIRSEPHGQGIFRCLQCKHEWEGIIPAPVDLTEGVECPECGTCRGVMKHLVAGDGEDGGNYFPCANCNNPHFIRLVTGFQCVACGEMDDE